MKRTVVISAVNIRKGGTLTILRDCLRYLSQNAIPEYRVIALVHDRELCSFPGIEYMEFPDTIRSWACRLWCEYVTMNRVSKQIAEQDGHKVWMWLSLHDTTPNVQAEHRQVYCHTSFPFMRVNLRDFIMDPKIPMFTMFTRFAYRINVHKNDNLIVQQEWFRAALSNMLGYPAEKIRVIPPVQNGAHVKPLRALEQVPVFLYASTPDCHKNFETLCRATELVQKEIGNGRFKVVLTVDGTENRYARWLKRKWGHVESIDFHGFMSKEMLYGYYHAAAALVFPSRVETWGLPISEFRQVSQAPMLLANLPYAHETGTGQIEWFNVTDHVKLAELMKEIIDKQQYTRK